MAASVVSFARLLLGVLALAGACAQQPQPAAPRQTTPQPTAPEQTASEKPGSTEPIHTLHVYMDLIQVPVLVLDSEHGRMKPIDPSRFLVSLDSGPAFRPKHVRQQGDDPITVGILLDTNADADLLGRMSSALAGLVPASLHPYDHVTLYGMDCKMVRTLNDVPAEAAVLKAGVERALAPWAERRKEKHAAPCIHSVQLWDGVSYAVKALGELPGRRALLVVSNGIDGGSRTTAGEAREFAADKGVAIFGYGASRSSSSSPPMQMSSSHGRGGRASMPLQTSSGPISTEDPFDLLCELSGGMIMSSDATFTGRQLTRFVTMLRERYILEFSRPRNDEPGRHDIQVTLARDNTAYIRPAGVSILVRDASLINDPTTIPGDRSDAPEMGTRKVLAGPK